MFLRNKKAQNFMEYSALIALVALGIILMRNYVYRGSFAHIKMWEDGAGDSITEDVQYAPFSYPPSHPVTIFLYEMGNGDTWAVFKHELLIGGCPYKQPYHPDNYATTGCFCRHRCIRGCDCLWDDLDELDDYHVFYSLEKWNKMIGLNVVDRSDCQINTSPRSCHDFNTPGVYLVIFEKWPFMPCGRKEFIAHVGGGGVDWCPTS